MKKVNVEGFQIDQDVKDLIIDKLGYDIYHSGGGIFLYQKEFEKDEDTSEYLYNIVIAPEEYDNLEDGNSKEKWGVTLSGWEEGSEFSLNLECFDFKDLPKATKLLEENYKELNIETTLKLEELEDLCENIDVYNELKENGYELELSSFIFNAEILRGKNVFAKRNKDNNLRFILCPNNKKVFDSSYTLVIKEEISSKDSPAIEDIIKLTEIDNVNIKDLSELENKIIEDYKIGELKREECNYVR